MKKRLLIAFAVFLLAGLVLGGFYFLSKLGPREVNAEDVVYAAEVPEELLDLRDRSVELEAQFEEILVVRDPDKEDLELLREAMEVQRSYVAQLPRTDSAAEERLDFLEKRYQDLATEGLFEESLALEAEAEDLAEEEDYEAARSKYFEAFEKQKLINEEYPLSASRNVGRATRLERKARYLMAEPLLERTKTLEAEADALIENYEWEKAEERLLRAIELQDQLNREYRGTNQASVSRLENLKVKLVGIRSGQSYLEIEEISDLADERRLAGENMEAANLYLEAARLQRQLNEAYPESPHASSEQVSEYQRKSQTAESRDLGLEIERNHDLLERLLAERRTYEAADVIVALRRDIRQMEEAFPRSSLNDEDLQVKIRYLNLLQNDLGYIQDRVYDALLPIPEEEEWRMLRSEVPQALYSLIMGTNPSRNPGDRHPVDSVSWTEAKSFCERLGWIMGQPVRLPTENEFRQALGRLRYVVLEEHVWSSADEPSEPQPVAAKEAFDSGFYDLLGNVSEWLESVDRFESEDARHIGGHIQDRLEAIFTVPVREAPRFERNRMTGFRFVVETGSGKVDDS